MVNIDYTLCEAKLLTSREKSKREAVKLMQPVEFLKLLEVIRQMDNRSIKRIANCCKLQMENRNA